MNRKQRNDRKKIIIGMTLYSHRDWRQNGRKVVSPKIKCYYVYSRRALFNEGILPRITTVALGYMCRPLFLMDMKNVRKASKLRAIFHTRADWECPEARTGFCSRCKWQRRCKAIHP
jgi:hypothetical protein